MFSGRKLMKSITCNEKSQNFFLYVRKHSMTQNQRPKLSRQSSQPCYAHAASQAIGPHSPYCASPTHSLPTICPYPLDIRHNPLVRNISIPKPGIIQSNPTAPLRNTPRVPPKPLISIARTNHGVPRHNNTITNSRTSNHPITPRSNPTPRIRHARTRTPGLHKVKESNHWESF